MMRKFTCTERIRWHSRPLWLALAGMLVFMIVADETGLRDRCVIIGLPTAAAAPMFLSRLIFAHIIINRRLLFDRTLQRPKQLNEQVERNPCLHQISGRFAMDVTLLAYAKD